MGVEIERRFLLAEPPSFLKRLDSHEIEQWYPPDLAGLQPPEEALEVAAEGIRIRRIDSNWIATVKGPWKGASRVEFEWDISPIYCPPEWPVINKTRYLWPDTEGLVWEIDVFHGEMDGLFIAEVELPAEDHPVRIPLWVVGEITGLEGWSNAELANSSWAEVEDCLMDARDLLLTQEGMDGD